MLHVLRSLQLIGSHSTLFLQSSLAKGNANDRARRGSLAEVEEEDVSFPAVGITGAAVVLPSMNQVYILRIKYHALNVKGMLH